jgi:hypothetical protein
VQNQFGKLESVLLCRPDHFHLQPINEIASDFLSRGELPDPKRVQREHRDFAG